MAGRTGIMETFLISLEESQSRNYTIAWLPGRGHADNRHSYVHMAKAGEVLLRNLQVASRPPP